MTTDIIKSYLELRQKLVAEKAQMEQRLKAISAALGDLPLPIVLPPPAKPAAKAVPKPVAKPAPQPVAKPAPKLAAKPAAPPAKAFVNPISLPKAVVQVTAKKPLTRQEILEAVLKLGYRFITKEPMKSLNPILYGKNPKLKRVDGKFTSANVVTAAKPKGQMSAAGRAAIVAAQKARWAKIKAAK